MSATEFQACLARAYTSASFRRLLRLEPVATLGRYFLSPAERRAIALIDLDAVDRFAAALKLKRRRRLERAYPALFALGEPAIDTFFDRYHEVYPRRPDDSDRRELIQFGTFIEQTVSDAGLLPPYAADLVRFERITQQPRGAGGVGAEDDGVAARTDLPDPDRPRRQPGVGVARFDYNVSEIDEALREGRRPTVRNAEEFIVYRVHDDESTPRVLRVSASVAFVVELCDGERAEADVVSAVELRFGEGDLAADVIAVIRRLAEAGILGVADGARV